MQVPGRPRRGTYRSGVTIPPGHEPPPVPSPVPPPPPVSQPGVPAAHDPAEHGEQGAASRWAPPPVSSPSAEPAWGTAPPPPTRHVTPPPTPPPPNPRRGKWLILLVLAASVAIVAVVLLTRGDDDGGGSGAGPTPSTELVEPTLENVRAALPTIEEVPEGWIVTTQPSTLTLYSVISGMMVCGVDTTGATAPSAEATVAFGPASGTEAGVSVAAVAMAGSTESRRLLEIGRAAANCVAKAGNAPGGLTVAVQPSVDVKGADSESLVLRVDGVPNASGPTTIFGVATTIGQFGVAATAPSVDQARELAESTLAGLRR